jgi:uncharacterized membrane protein YedE/YeeE
VTRCPWYVAGPLLGLLIVGLRATLNKPLGALGGYIDLAAVRFGFRASLLVGFVLGGAIFAVASGTFSLSLSYGVTTLGGAQIALLIVAGIAMGFGARTAGGCTSGHGLCGVSLGSPASFTATATFFVTAMALARLFPGGTP